MSLGLSIRDLLGRLSEAEGEQLSGRFKEPVIRLGAASVSRDAPTDLVRLDGKTALTVGTVLFVWWSREKKGIEFIRLRQQDREAAKVTQTISPNEREALIRFLKGEVQPGECSLFAGVVDLHDKQVEQTEKGITALENELGALVRSERKLKELNNVLNVKNATFLELYQSLKQKHFEDAKNASADKAKEKVSGSKRSSQADSSQNKSLKRSKDDSTTSTSSKQTPIVIIPSSTSSLSLISIYNIKEFLELGKFELTEEKKKKASSRTFQTPLLISKTSRTDKKKKFKLEVCDDTSKLNPADWYDSPIYFVFMQVFFLMLSSVSLLYALQGSRSCRLCHWASLAIQEMDCRWKAI